MSCTQRWFRNKNDKSWFNCAMADSDAFNLQLYSEYMVRMESHAREDEKAAKQQKMEGGRILKTS